MGKRKIAAVLSICLVLGACSTNKETGMLAGAAAGAAAGSRMGDGSGRLVAIAVGALIGGFAGAAIGERLDEADKLKKEAAAREAASSQTGKPVSWRSNSQPNTYGYSEPISEPVVTPAKTLLGSTVSGEKTCRKIRDVVIVKGVESKEEAEYCLKDGTWVRA